MDPDWAGAANGQPSKGLARELRAPEMAGRGAGFHGDYISGFVFSGRSQWRHYPLLYIVRRELSDGGQHGRDPIFGSLVAAGPSRPHPP